RGNSAGILEDHKDPLLRPEQEADIAIRLQLGAERDSVGIDCYGAFSSAIAAGIAKTISARAATGNATPIGNVSDPGARSGSVVSGTRSHPFPAGSVGSVKSTFSLCEFMTISRRSSARAMPSRPIAGFA